MRITIETFKPEHLGMIVEFHNDGPAMKELLKQKPEYPHLLFHAGPAFSGFDERGEYFGSLGMCMFWDGVGKLWLILDKRISGFRKSFHKLIKSRVELWFEMYHMRRICTDVAVGDPRAIRWIESLGFEREGLQKSYGPNGEDYFLYAMVRG